MQLIRFHYPLLLLGQEFVESFTIRYFSYIILGLMMCVGWILFRFYGKKKDNEKEKRNKTEDFLNQAAAEARRMKLERDSHPRQPLASEKPQGPDVLALTPDQLRHQEELKRLVEDHDAAKQEPAAGNAEEGISGDQRTERGTIS